MPILSKESWMMLILPSGYDAPFHLSEECSNANIAAPRAIVLTSGVGGLFGWFLQLVVAYTVIDIPSVISSDLGQPWASYLLQVLPQKTALAALALTIIAAFSMGQGCMVRLAYFSFHGGSLTKYSIGRRLPSHLRLCPRWLFPMLLVDQPCKQTYPDPRQCRLVQYGHRHPHDAPYIRRNNRSRRALLHCSNSSVRRIHHPYIHSSVLRRK